MECKTQSRKNLRWGVRSMCAIAMMTGLIVIGAWITIPFTVPFTMQIFAVALALLLLGGTKGTVAVLMYLLLGAFGVPVFSGFKGGLAAITGPTGGYMTGFILMGLLFIPFAKSGKWRIPVSVAKLLLGLLCVYAFGTAWFAHVAGNGRSVWAILTLCVFPYIIPDLIKIAVAVVVAESVRRTGILRELD